MSISPENHQRMTPDQQWAKACAMAVDICGKVTRGADLSVELAEAFKRLLSAVDALQAERTRVLREVHNEIHGENDRNALGSCIRITEICRRELPELALPPAPGKDQ